MNKFYIDVDKNNIIRDVIEYPYDDYMEVELEIPLPDGIYGGWFKYIDGEIVEVPELKSYRVIGGFLICLKGCEGCRISLQI